MARTNLERQQMLWNDHAKGLQTPSHCTIQKNHQDNECLHIFQNCSRMQSVHVVQYTIIDQTACQMEQNWLRKSLVCQSFQISKTCTGESLFVVSLLKTGNGRWIIYVSQTPARQGNTLAKWLRCFSKLHKASILCTADRSSKKRSERSMHLKQKHHKFHTICKVMQVFIKRHGVVSLPVSHGTTMVIFLIGIG